MQGGCGQPCALLEAADPICTDALFVGACRYNKSFRSDHPTFNAGVYGVNFDLWRQKAIHKEVLYWMKQVCVML